jgi:hypothetical protein
VGRSRKNGSAPVKSSKRLPRLMQVRGSPSTKRIHILSTLPISLQSGHNMEIISHVARPAGLPPTSLPLRWGHTSRHGLGWRWGGNRCKHGGTQLGVQRANAAREGEEEEEKGLMVGAWRGGYRLLWQ